MAHAPAQQPLAIGQCRRRVFGPICQILELARIASQVKQQRRHAFVGEVHMLHTREAVRNGGSVEFVRRGGVDIVPDSILMLLDPYGRFFFNPDPLGAGDVIFDLIFKLYGYGPETVRRTISTSYVDNPIDLTEVLYLPCVPFDDRIPCL